MYSREGLMLIPPTLNMSVRRSGPNHHCLLLVLYQVRSMRDVNSLIHELTRLSLSKKIQSILPKNQARRRPELIDFCIIRSHMKY